MAGEQFYQENNVRISSSVRFRVSDSASVSFVVNTMFEIAGREVLLALCLHNSDGGYTQGYPCVQPCSY